MNTENETTGEKKTLGDTRRLLTASVKYSSSDNLHENGKKKEETNKPG